MKNYIFNLSVAHQIIWPRQISMSNKFLKRDIHTDINQYANTVLYLSQALAGMSQ